MIFLGDTLETLTKMADNSVDSIVTDPPYGIKFMAKKWDYEVPSVEVWKEALRVLKPGGHLLSFAGSRTQHRMCVNIEDAGFQIRDMIAWVYGSGFPKSLNIGKTVDPFEGWGTALKPALEPITLARKPLSEKTIAANVLKWGTGGINIDGCRVGLDGEKPPTGSAKRIYAKNQYAKNGGYGDNKETSLLGRFPANLIHDGHQLVLDLFPITKSGKDCTRKIPHQTNAMAGTLDMLDREEVSYGDKGSAARFFYCAKASKSERNKGLEGFEEKQYSHDGRNKEIENAFQRNKSVAKNNHPTVKPVKLMRYLCRLITPPGGTILDLYVGSGSTGVASALEGFPFIGIDNDKNAVDIANARIINYI